jgi:hypothetical protein
MREKDDLLMKDIGVAGPELERRLSASIRVEDGLVTVKDPLLGSIQSHFLPATTPWVLSCGIGGISVAFGTSISGDGTSVGNDVEVRLGYAMFDEKACAVLGPRLGKQLRAILETH